MTKRRSKSKSPIVASGISSSPVASTSWQNLGIASPAANARMSIARFSPLKEKSVKKRQKNPGQLMSPLRPVSPLRPRERAIMNTSPTFMRRHGIVPYFHLEDMDRSHIYVPSEAARVTAAKKELASRAEAEKKRLALEAPKHHLWFQ